jgi:hypothetical protein
MRNQVVGTRAANVDLGTADSRACSKRLYIGPLKLHGGGKMEFDSFHGMFQAIDEQLAAVVWLPPIGYSSNMLRDVTLVR